MTPLDVCMTALRSGDPRARQAAAMRVGTLDATEVMGELVSAMAVEPDAFVRETLIWAVVSRPRAATAHLVAALERDLPREPILHALSKIGDPATVPAILPFATHADSAVAAKAWWALGCIAADESLPALLAHLGAAEAERRAGLTRAVLQFGAAAIDPLGEALESTDAAVRSHAAEILVAFSDPTRCGALQRRAGRDPSPRAAELLRRSPAPEVDGALLLATLDEDHPEAAAAARALRDLRR